MRNVLLKRQMVTSKTDVERPTSVEPVPESVSGHVNAYRGMEQHGVEPTANYAAMPGFDESDEPLESYAPREEPADPIRVIVVNQSARERRNMRTVVGYAGSDTGNATAVLGADRARSSARIRNTHDTAVVYISHEERTANAMSGYPIRAGEYYDTHTQAEVYAKSDQTENIPVAIAIEYGEPL